MQLKECEIPCGICIFSIVLSTTSILCIHPSIVNKKISRHTRDNHKEVGLIFLQQEYTQLGKAVDDALSQIGLFWGDRTLVSRGLGVYVVGLGKNRGAENKRLESRLPSYNFIVLATIDSIVQKWTAHRDNVDKTIKMFMAHLTS